MMVVVVDVEVLEGHREGEMILRVPVGFIQFTNIPPRNENISFLSSLKGGISQNISKIYYVVIIILRKI